MNLNTELTLIGVSVLLIVFATWASPLGGFWALAGVVCAFFAGKGVAIKVQRAHQQERILAARAEKARASMAKTAD